MKIKNTKPIFRIVFLGLCLAFYVVLGFVSIDLKVFKITFISIPILLAAVLYGPIDGLIVGLLGEFICQAISVYGLTPTTPLWVIPPALRGLIVGLLFKNKDVKAHPVRWIITMIVSSLIVTAANTLVIFLDAKIFDYPSGLTAIVVVFRFVGSIVTAAIVGTLVPLLFEALKKTPFIEKDSD